MDVETLGNFLFTQNSLDDIPIPTQAHDSPLSYASEFVIASPPDSSLHLPLLTISPVPSPPTDTSHKIPSPPTIYTPSPVIQTPSPQPYSRTPSPTQYSVPSPTDPFPTKKRKQESLPSSPERSSREWREYLLGPQYFQVHDAMTLQPLTEHLDVTAQQIGSKFTFSECDETWICYRQNQFKVFSLFRGPQAVETMCVNDGGIPKRITQMCAKLYAINEVGDALRDELRVGLHHAGKKRVKSAKMDVEITPFEKGKIEFTNLQFERSNASKPFQSQQEYFHIIVVLYADCQGTFYPILSKISPRIIVRGQNPGFYEEHDRALAKKAEALTAGDTSTNFVATSSVNNNISVNYETIITTTQTINNFNNLQPTISPTDIPTHLLEDIKIDPKDINLDITNTDPNSPNIGQGIYDDIVHDIEKDGWRCVSDKVYHYGKVGINTSDPKEALHVQGNMMVTGTVYKPSDMRIKSEIQAVDTKTQLGNVRKLRIYDYVVDTRQEKERGVLAQELAAVLPEAVHDVGDVKVNNTTIPNLLVVNERTLLYENIGATQQLDKQLETEKENIVDIHSRVSEVTESAAKTSAQVQTVAQELLDLFFREEKKDKVSYLGLEEEYISFGVSIFKMGPARSLFVIGHFAPFAWVLGSLYIFSNIKQRRFLGASSLIRYLVYLTLAYLVDFHVISVESSLNNYYGCLTAGTSILIANYIRHRKNLKKEPNRKLHITEILNAMKVEPPEHDYKYIFL